MFTGPPGEEAMVAVHDTGEADGAEAQQSPDERRRFRFRPPGKRGAAALAVVLAALLAVPLVLWDTGTDETADAAGPKAAAHATLAEAARLAKRSGHDIEATGQRTANSTTWAKPDGLFRTRTYSDTIRAKSHGKWQKIDTDLTPVDGGFAPKAVNDPLVFSAGSGARDQTSRAAHRTALAEQGVDWSPLVRVSTAGHELTVSWPGPLPRPVVHGAQALYQDVRPGVDLLLTARSSGYSHVLIVHDREAASDPLLKKLRYRFTSADLSFQLDEESGALQVLDAEGVEVAAAPTPYAWDSAGARAVTVGQGASASPKAGDAPDALSLAGLDGPQPGSHDTVMATELAEDGTLSITTDRDWLQDPETEYPVFLDPSLKGHKDNWTLLYKPYPNSSYWNGQNFNNGTNEARIGFETTTDGLSRSVFTFEHQDSLDDVEVTSAYLHMLQTYSWSCSSRQYDVWLTGTINSSSSWNNQPSWADKLTSLSNGYGYSSGSCPDHFVRANVKSAAQEASDKHWNTITLGLRAANESDTYAWKKIRANGENSPYIEIEYNRKPDLPTNLTMSPGPDCDWTSPYPSVGKTDLTFRARGDDPDGNLEYLHFRVWPTGDYDHIVLNKRLRPDSNGYADTTVQWEDLTHGRTYSWDVRAEDTEGAVSTHAPPGSDPCRFVVDHEAPPSPTVTSEQFPAADGSDATWSTLTFGTDGSFTVEDGAGGDVDEYQYSFNRNSFGSSVSAGSDGSATISATPPKAGPNILYVRAVDSVGNVSKQTSYRFYVSPRPGLDVPGDTNGDGYPDLLVITEEGRLRVYPANSRGDMHSGMDASYTTEGDSYAPTPDGYWTGALITHNGDWMPGDGLQDLVARIDGALYIYPGDGYSGFDVSKRRKVLLPDNAPDPDDLTQILSVGDVDGDGHPDMFAKAGAQLWIFTGYSGGSFATAHQMTQSAWDGRDLVLVDDMTGDGTADLIFRTYGSGRLYLREGKPSADGTATDILSLGLAATSRTGSDAVYGEEAWEPSNIPLLIGTPDADSDNIPDIWVMFKSGNVYIYPGGRTTHGAPRKVITEATEGTDWTRPVALG